MVKRPLVEITKSQIDDLRTAFLADLSSKPSDSIHPNDLDKIQNSDAWLKRFCLHQRGNKEKALNMLWTAVTWRKEQKVNEINETNVKMDVLCSGEFFVHGADIDDSKLFVFKCSKHTKGSVDMDALKRCVLYWFERTERLTKGQMVTLFFDMEGCGLSNLDMEVIKYLISLFETYYPYFLNYILIYEMPWILNAAFKIIKSLLPEEGVEKIKFVSKKDITNFVPSEHVLQSWGGQNTYTFSFIPETIPEKEKVAQNNINNKKVHFVDGSMSETTAASNGDKETDGGYLKVTPSGIITFVKDGNELISNLELQNTDVSIHVSYKLKTTSPEKFRVKPSTGCLAPGESANVNVTLLPGFQLGGLSRDKFLVMSTLMEPNELEGLDLPELWKNTSGRKVFQHRLKCIQSGEVTKNGNATVPNQNPIESDQTNLVKVSSSITEIKEAQIELRRAVKLTQYMQIVTLLLVLVLGFVLGYMTQNSMKELPSDHSYCRDSNI